MAKLEATLDANITPFERALDAAKEKAKEFGEGIADVGKDAFKGFTGLDLSKLMGIGAATYAATKLGEALVDAAKEGYAAFAKYQEAVLRFKYTMPAAPGTGAEAQGRAEEAVETAISKAGIFSAEQMENAAQSLMLGSKEFRESQEKLGEMLDTIKALAIKTGGSPEAIAESYRRLMVSIKEEGSPAVGKFFKATPGLEAETEKLRDAHAQAYLHAQGLADASEANTAQLAEYQRLQSMPISEFMTEESKRKGATAVLEEIKEILERSAPKGISAEAEAIEPGKMLAAAWEKISDAIGDFVKPKVDEILSDLTRVLTASLPVVKAVLETISGYFEFWHGTATAVVEKVRDFEVALFNLANTGNVLTNVFQALIAPVQALAGKINDFLGNTALEQAKAISEHVDEVKKQKLREKEAREAPEKAAKEALLAPTGIFSKERIKAEEEAAKIAARADAAHAETQRRISFEAAQADLRSQAIAAARRAVIDRPIGATEQLDKESAIQAESAAKIINLKAAAAAKANAAEEEAANRIAKIEEEQTLRNIERQSVSVMDDGAEKEAALARLNAEDDAAVFAREDAISESREKIREADIDAANAIIDAQEEAAARIIDAQEAAALSQLAKMKGPYQAMIEEAPAMAPEFGHWGRHGEYHESEYERSEREKRNREASEAAEEQNRQWKELQGMAIRREFEEKKRIVEDALEAQRPTQISLKHVHEVQQEEHVKAIAAGKLRTEADLDFAAQHEKLGLPPSPDKAKAGAGDVSRKLLAEILAKILEAEISQTKDFEKVFMSE